MAATRRRRIWIPGRPRKPHLELRRQLPGSRQPLRPTPQWGQPRLDFRSLTFQSLGVLVRIETPVASAWGRELPRRMPVPRPARRVPILPCPHHPGIPGRREVVLARRLQSSAQAVLLAQPAGAQRPRPVSFPCQGAAPSPGPVQPVPALLLRRPASGRAGVRADRRRARSLGRGDFRIPGPLTEAWHNRLVASAWDQQAVDPAGFPCPGRSRIPGFRTWAQDNPRAASALAREPPAFPGPAQARIPGEPARDRVRQVSAWGLEAGHPADFPCPASSRIPGLPTGLRVSRPEASAWDPCHSGWPLGGNSRGWVDPVRWDSLA